jgi:hypothetical protein
MKLCIAACDITTFPTEDGMLVEIEVEPGDIIPITLLARGEKKLSEAHIRIIVQPSNQLCLLEVKAVTRCETRP